MKLLEKRPWLLAVIGLPLIICAGIYAQVSGNFTGTLTLSGISGAVPYFTSATTIASSGALVAGAPVLGGGAGGAPTTAGAAVQYNGQALAGNGLTAVVGYATAAGSGASITTANLIASAPAGVYKITAYLATSTAGSGNVVTTLGWTDSVGAKTSATPGTLTLTSGTFVQGSILVQVAASSNLTYATAWTGTGNYNIFVIAERVQ
jgi:hypothetical protein